MKYFAFSDIHGFTTIFKNKLNEVGFDINNPEHKIILCGDALDRGPEPFEMIEFLKSLGDKLIFVRGNHEILFEDCLKQYLNGENISNHHKSNGTAATIESICQKYWESKGKKWPTLYLEAYQYKWDGNKEASKFVPYIESLKMTMQEYQENVRKRNEFLQKYDPNKYIRELYKPAVEVLEWIKSKTINYFETKDYVFVHGWIPFTYTSINYWGSPVGGVYDKEWRKSNEDQWSLAVWDNGYDWWKKGIKDPEKIIVCGHITVSYYWSTIKHLRKECPPKNRKDWQKSFEMVEDDGLIGLDACTVYSGLMNCFVFEE